jgi:hypothetical protein
MWSGSCRRTRRRPTLCIFDPGAQKPSSMRDTRWLSVQRGGNSSSLAPYSSPGLGTAATRTWGTERAALEQGRGRCGSSPQLGIRSAG